MVLFLTACLKGAFGTSHHVALKDLICERKRRKDVKTNSHRLI
jgi:hypothetical protein